MMGQRSSQTSIFLGDAGYLTRQRDETGCAQPTKECREEGWAGRKRGGSRKEDLDVGTTPVYILWKLLRIE